MSKKLFIGIDNGASGTIGVVGGKVYFDFVPTKKELSYTKKKQYITRLDYNKFISFLFEIGKGFSADEIIVGIERPMVNPQRFKASMSAIRFLEATLIALEQDGLPYVYIDSKQWQRLLLPSGIKGSAELKKASLLIGNRLFPQHKDHKAKDRDGLLIAEFLRKTF